MQHHLHPGHQQQRSVSGPAALTDKVLPLTPTSGVFDRSDDNYTGGSPTPPSSIRTKASMARTPPQIRVDEPEDFFRGGDTSSNEVDEAQKDGRPLIEELPTPLEDALTTMHGGDEGERLREEENDDEKDERYEGDCQPSKPPLTRSPLSELGGSARKPLPALPEDPR